MKNLLKQMALTVLPIVAALAAYSADLTAQGPGGCPNSLATEVTCPIQGCVTTGVTCPEPPDYEGSSEYHYIYQDCQELTGYSCGGTDIGCNCITSMGGDLDCPLKWSCSPEEELNKCTVFDPTGCGTVKNDRYTNCVANGCDPQ